VARCEMELIVFWMMRKVKGNECRQTKGTIE